jgi:hypothetical protein
VQFPRAAPFPFAANAFILLNKAPAFSRRRVSFFPFEPAPSGQKIFK